VQGRIAEKIDWLATNADRVIHHPLKSMTNGLNYGWKFMMIKARALLAL